MARKGTQTATTTDAVVGISGVPTIVYSAVVRGSGTATVVSLRDGTAATATALDTIDAGINTTVRVNYGANGMLFPNGCFLDVDANTSFATIVYEAARNV